MGEPKPKRPSLGARLAAGFRRAAEAAAERPERTYEQARGTLAARSRRDFLLLGAGLVACTAAGWWLLPERTKRAWLPGAADRLDTLAARVGLTRMRREAQLNRVLTFDDDVAEALYSRDRLVRTYERPDARPLRNNYHGRTPGPDYLAGWRLTLSGLASGQVERLPIEALRSRFARREMNTRLVCVEGWSHVAAWGGFRFGELLDAYPPAPAARWAALRSMVSLDARGEPEPYYVSLDLETARHPQALLATHHAGAPLTLAHGAPLRLVVPMKLGLKNIKAITDIAYTADEPADYWNERGYSRYDGI
jgi:DMSO/TMAO reductase YedYZ molybdopterin-dependent catalytic subunit